MTANKSILNHKESQKSYRERKSEELRGFALSLENDTLDTVDEGRLISMLNKSAENLVDVNDDWMIENETLSEITRTITESFYFMQDALEVMDRDNFENEWRCDFSNRLMHKSMKLQSFKKKLIQVQKSVYNLLSDVVDNSFQHLIQEADGAMDITDFYFYIPQSKR